jgi:hypothetical protein
MPLITWMRDMLSVDYVDLVTYPGVDGFVAQQAELATRLLKTSVDISVQKHASPVLALVGHHDCAANPGSADAHREQLLSGLRALQGWNLGVKLVALWVNAEWQIEVVRTRGAEATAR